jgi:hypothetical protein
MSSHSIILIPENPTYVPPSAQQERAVKRLWEISPEADEVRSQVYEGIQFIHCGENFERVICPSCSAEVDGRWWAKKMDEDYDPDLGFSFSYHELLCCGIEATLPELKYEWSQGFARYCIEMTNPNIGKLDEPYVREFEQILDCSLSVVYQHM